MIILLVFALFIIGCGSNTELDAFAQCITDSGAKEFGAYWCPNCQQQKAMFGDSWDKIIYIECSLPGKQGQTEICAQAGIESYPTWEFMVDGKKERQVGKMSLAQLAIKTGCPLP